MTTTDPKSGEVRIIAGSLRGRKLVFKDPTATLRPTPNRVRETLFNWLAPHIRGAVCLDLFAGSGALSFEAISRGADRVIAIEQNKDNVQMLQAHAVKWNIQNLDILQMDCRHFLQQRPTTQPFDIVFVDPPYQSNLLTECIELLAEHHWLKMDSLIYFESNQDIDPKDLPLTWEILKAKKAGQVFFYLARVL